MGSLVGIELLGSGPLVGGDKNGFIKKGRDGVVKGFSRFDLPWTLGRGSFAMLY